MGTGRWGLTFTDMVQLSQGVVSSLIGSRFWYAVITALKFPESMMLFWRPLTTPPHVSLIPAAIPTSRVPLIYVSRLCTLVARCINGPRSKVVSATITHATQIVTTPVAAEGKGLHTKANAYSSPLEN